MAEAQKIITSSDVHLFYGKFEALKGINLDFNEHEITALIGPSGCGKSTYLRTLNRMNDLIPGDDYRNHQFTRSEYLCA